MSDDYCFSRSAQGQLSQCNSRSTILGAVVKSHRGLKGKKVFAFGCSVRNLKNLARFTGRNPCWSPFIVKLQSGIAYKKAKVKVTRATLSKRDAYTEPLIRVPSSRF